MQESPALPSRRLLSAIVAFAALAPGGLMTAPAIAAQLSVQLHLSPSYIGFLFSTELGAMSLATFPAWWWLGRCHWHRVALLSVIVFTVGNVVSAFAGTFALLLPCRFIASLAGGTLMILCITSAATTRNSGRVFSLWILGQLLLGAVGLLVLPPLFARFGLMTVYLLLAILMMGCFPLIRAFPAGLAVQKQTKNITGPYMPGLLAALAVLLFYTGQSAVWAFSGTIAADAGLDRIHSGQILAVATVFGMMGACITAALSSHSHRRFLLLLGYVLLLVGIALFSHHPLSVRFALAAVLFEFSWIYVLPLILSRVAALDNNGKLMNAINLVIGGGQALGPSIAGYLLENSGGQTGVMLLTAALSVVVSLVFISLAAYHQAKKNRHR
ncbi:MFS transporter [Pantoea coffeiphila]|uniref:MFS transporter n=1 Tax=Pantoea coffeiphila TaxID=1465635 RepID=UPI001960C8CB|nr:MFS transporter [Pantoea coffeiphila]MBM7341514.1 putative MFS family arabinose efflux permease [Pantoea coffeiphila]